MGDRTWVNLRVPRELADTAREIVTQHYNEPDEDDEDDDDRLHCFGFSEVNYGSLDYLTDEGALSHLQAAGIAYDSSWENGGNYNAGTRSCRFTEQGDAVVMEVYDEDVGIDPLQLMPHIDDHAKLKELILKHLENTDPLPWDNQVEYGKLYRLKQLICPT